LKALTDEAKAMGNESVNEVVDAMNAEIAEVQTLARESIQHARILATCAARHA
jgi:hypothetical protein